MVAHTHTYLSGSSESPAVVKVVLAVGQRDDAIVLLVHLELDGSADLHVGEVGAHQLCLLFLSALRGRVGPGTTVSGTKCKESLAGGRYQPVRASLVTMIHAYKIAHVGGFLGINTLFWIGRTTEQCFPPKEGEFYVPHKISPVLLRGNFMSPHKISL